MASPAADSAWKKVFDELVIEIQPAPAPVESAESVESAQVPWFQTLARFGRQSFLRVLFGAEDKDWVIYMQIAPGSATSHGEGASMDRAGQLAGVLTEQTPARWSVSSAELPWVLEGRLDADEDRADLLRKVFIKLMKLADGIDREANVYELMGLLGGDTAASKGDKIAAVKEVDAPSLSSGSLFESIGGEGSESGQKSGPLRISEAHARATPTHVEVALGLSELLTTKEIDELRAGFDHHLRIKFDVRVEPIEVPTVSSLATSKTDTKKALYFKITSTDDDVGLGQLHELISSYMRRVEEFSSLGVELYDILGLHDTILTSKRAPSGASSGRSSPVASPESFATPSAPTPSYIAPLGDSSPNEVVFDLGGPMTSAGGKDLLSAGQFEDERLRRPDANTALVDIVLRHPGYSDMRIGQVLSILLSIEYHRALQLAERAPCVIAWGLGQERAQSFKGVIETAGGKVLLVEPGTFGEA